METKEMTKKKETKGSVLDVGNAVIVRTITNFYIGRVASCDAEWLTLDDASWLAESERWGETLATGRVRELEPYPGRVLVARASIVDVSPWMFDCPRTAKP